MAQKHVDPDSDPDPQHCGIRDKHPGSASLSGTLLAIRAGKQSHLVLILSADIMLPIPINYLREQSHESLQADQEQLLLVERLLLLMLLRLLLVLLRLSGALPLAGAL